VAKVIQEKTEFFGLQTLSNKFSCCILSQKSTPKDEFLDAQNDLS
jgi:hypothetical protein